MAPNNLAKNLLFGVLALKVDVFDAPRFTKYCSAWAGRDEISLADWLVKRGWISSTDRAAVDHLVELKVRKHGSLEASLAAAIDAEVMQALQAVEDPRIRRFVAGLAGAGESESGAGTRPSVHVADTLFTASKPQSPGSGGEILVSAMDRGSTPKTEDDLLSQPRQRGGVLRILATVGVTAVVVGLICLAVSQMRLAEANKRAEQAREQLAQRDRQAREYLALAREAVDEFQSKVHNDPQFKERNLDLWRQAVLKKAVDSYEKFVAQWGEDPDLLAELARAYGRLGKSTGVVGNKNEAVALFEQAIPIEEKLVANYPDRIVYSVDLGANRCEMADLLRQTDRTKEAMDQLDKAIQGLGAVLERDPHDLTARRYLAVSHNIRGSIYDKPDQSKEEFQRGVALLEKQLADQPRSVQDVVLLSMIYGNLGELRRRFGTAEEAVSWCRRAVETLERVETKNAATGDFQMMLARSYYALGVAYFGGKQLDRAEESWAKALSIAERLATRHPDVAEYQVLLARNQNNLGVIHLRRNRFKEAEKAFSEALATNKKLIAQNPNIPECQADIANGHGNLGEVYSALGLQEKAAESLREATAIRKKLVADHPANTQYRISLASSFMGLAKQKLRTLKLEEALAAYRQAEDVYDGSKPMAEIAQQQYHLAESYKDLALRYKTAGNMDQANVVYRRMLAVVEKLVASYPDRMDYGLGLGSTEYEFGFFLNEQGKSEEALTWYGKAVQTLEALQKKEPGHSEVRKYLCHSHWARARALVQLKRSQEAIADFEQAIELDTGVSRNAMWWERTLAQARAGECEQATSQAERRMEEKKGPAPELYQAARIFAVASVTIRDQAGLTAAEQGQRADQYAARAVAILQQIQVTGFFRNNPAAVTQLKQEADLQVLQKRQEYQKLIKSIEDAVAP